MDLFNAPNQESEENQEIEVIETINEEITIETKESSSDIIDKIEEGKILSNEELKGSVEKNDNENEIVESENVLDKNSEEEEFLVPIYIINKLMYIISYE